MNSSRSPAGQGSTPAGSGRWRRDFTKPLLFLADGDYYNNLAVHGWDTDANVDLIAIYLTGLATLLLLLIPFIPGLRDLPRWIPVHRLIWRDWNRQAAGGSAGQPKPGPQPEPAGCK